MSNSLPQDWLSNADKSGLVVSNASFLHNNPMRFHRHLIAYDGPADTGDGVLLGRHGSQLRFIHMLHIRFGPKVVDPTNHRGCVDQGHMIIVVSIVINMVDYRGRVDNLNLLVSPRSRPVGTASLSNQEYEPYESNHADKNLLADDN